MKQGRSLPDLATELHRQADAKRDFLAQADAIRVSSNGHTRLILNEEFPVNDVAHAQIAEYTGVPKIFYDRLRGATNTLRVPSAAGSEDAPLFDVLINGLLSGKGGEGRLVRTLDGNARAFLSSSYNPDLDNYDVFRMAATAIEEAGLCPDNVVSCEVTERRLYLKVVSDKVQAVVHPSNLKDSHGRLREPQVVQAGFILTNSETGLGSLSVQQVIMKLMCTNLWIQEEAVRVRHVGKALETDDSGRIYRSDTRLADAKARLLKIRDHIGDALDETRFQETVARMQTAAEVRLEGSVEKTVELTASKFGLLQSEKETVLRSLIEGADLSLWGLTNAITATAQTVLSYDRATELEAIGGRFFTLSSAEVRQLAGTS